MKSAREWNAALQTFRSEAGNEQQQNFLIIQSDIEAQAAEIFDRLRHIELPAAIDHAAQHGHYTVAFEVASWHLATDAFVAFRDWLKSNDFTCMAAQLDPTAREHPQQDIVLNIIPLA